MSAPGFVRIVSHDAIYFTVEALDASGAVLNDADWTDLATARAFTAWLQNAATDANLSGLYSDILRDAGAALQALGDAFAALREVTERARHAARALEVPHA